MTIDEMHYDFMIKADKVASSQKKNFNAAEIDWFLNDAQEVFVNKIMNKGFEYSQTRIDELSSIHIKFPLQPPLILDFKDVTENIQIYEAVLDNLLFAYMYFVKANVYLKPNDLCENRSYLKIVQNDDFEEILKSPFLLDENTVLGNFGKSSTNHSSLYLYSKFPIKENKLYIEYIKTPVQMNLGNYVYLDGITKTKTNCELPSSTHREIVDLAVAIAYNTLDNNSYTLKKDKLTYTESFQ
jgi:hypothetical protein